MKRFEEAYDGWIEKRLSQEEAARILGVSDRTFRRYVERYDDGGQEALVDSRLSQTSHSKAPVDEVMALTKRYRARHDGWSARHFHTWYKRDGGTRSYTWVKTRLQEARLIKKAPCFRYGRRRIGVLHPAVVPPRGRMRMETAPPARILSVGHFPGHDRFSRPMHPPIALVATGLPASSWIGA